MLGAYGPSEIGAEDNYNTKTTASIAYATPGKGVSLIDINRYQFISEICIQFRCISISLESLSDANDQYCSTQ